MEAFPLDAQQSDSNNLENTAKDAGNEVRQENAEDPPQEDQDQQNGEGSPAAKREGSFNGSANGDQKSGE